MLPRVLPISGGRLSAGVGRRGVGREAAAPRWSATRQHAAAFPPLETSAHSFLYQDVRLFRLHIQPFISLYTTLTCSPVSHFLIFLSETVSALSSRARPAAAPLLVEQKNDLISPLSVSAASSPFSRTDHYTQRPHFHLSVRANARL